MTSTNLLDPLTEIVIVSDAPQLVNLVRWMIFVFSIMTSAFLLKLYPSPSLGRMNYWAKIGSIGIYACVAWAQPIAIANGATDLIPLNIFVLIFSVSSFIGVVKVMDSKLFKRKH